MNYKAIDIGAKGLKKVAVPAEWKDLKDPKKVG